MSELTPSQKLIKQNAKHLEDYLKAITDEERTAFLLSILRESSAQEKVPFKLAPNVASNASLADFPLALSAIAEQNSLCQRCGCSEIDCDFGNCENTNHNTSYVTINYPFAENTQSTYEIVVHINHDGIEHYGTDQQAMDRIVSAPIAYQLFISGRISGPINRVGGGYFQSGNNQTPGSHTGALAIEVFEPGTNNRVTWGIWYFNDGFGSFGDQWLRCGQDYTFNFADQ